MKENQILQAGRSSSPDLLTEESPGRRRGKTPAPLSSVLLRASSPSLCFLSFLTLIVFTFHLVDSSQNHVVAFEVCTLAGKHESETMKIARSMVLLCCICAATVCTPAPEDSSSGSGAAQGQSVPQGPPQTASPQTRSTGVGTLTFPSYTPERQKEIRSLSPGQWIPVRMDRNYLVLRGGGIRVEAGDYFVQLLSDTGGKVTSLLLARKRGAKLEGVDLEKGTARDGSLATVLEVVSEIEGINPYNETKAYISSSGESAQVWVHLEGGRVEWRAELMGLAGPSPKPRVHR